MGTPKARWDLEAEAGATPEAEVGEGIPTRNHPPGRILMGGSARGKRGDGFPRIIILPGGY